MASIADITFETPDYAEGDAIGSKAAWNVLQVLDANRPSGYKFSANNITAGADGAGVLTVDTHEAHSPGEQVVDMSTIGEQIATHATTQLATDNHEAEIVVFPDLVNAGAGSYAAQSVLLRGQGDGSADQSGYLVRWQSRVDDTSKAVILRLDSLDLVQLAESADLDDTYAETSLHTLRGRIDGTVITAYINDTLVLTYDTAGDGTSYATGKHVGIGQVRWYSASGTQVQPFFDTFAAADLAAGPAAVAITDAAATMSAGPMTPTAGSVARSIDTATATMQAGTIAASPGPSDVALPPVGMTLTAAGVTPTAGTAQRGLTAVAATMTAHTVSAAAQPAQRNIGPATMAMSAHPVAPTVGGPAQVSIGPAVMTATAETLTIAAGSQIIIGPAESSMSAGPLVPFPGVAQRSIGPAAAVFSAYPVAPTAGRVFVAMLPALMAMTSGQIAPGVGAVTVEIAAGSVTVSAMVVVPSPLKPQVVIAAATITVSAATITATARRAAVVIAPSTMTISAATMNPIDPSRPVTWRHIDEAARFLRGVR